MILPPGAISGEWTLNNQAVWRKLEPILNYFSHFSVFYKSQTFATPCQIASMECVSMKTKGPRGKQYANIYHQAHIPGHPGFVLCGPDDLYDSYRQSRWPGRPDQGLPDGRR